jgi:hypothetical protein
VECGWCGKPARMLALTIEFQGARGAGTLDHPVMCHTCEALVFGEDEETLAETRVCALRLMALRQRKFEKQPHRCWSCSRPAAPVTLAWQDTAFAEATLDDPTICPTCLALLGLSAFGFAAADEAFYEARMDVVIALVNTPKTEVPVAPMRRRLDELVLVKVALLERAHHDYTLDDTGGYDYLAGQLGLSLNEVEAEVERLLAQRDAQIVLRAVDGVLAPRLNARGWLRVRGLQKLHREGPPYLDPALRSRALRRALERLSVDVVEAA